ncbi:cobalamin-binding protein [Paraglaciecola sp.]|uniref:cobalamin-binding protein n=1 Tax=Paraglaciecola sp. TaxID=1920173 RepID=UPI0030F42689
MPHRQYFTPVLCLGLLLSLSLLKMPSAYGQQSETAAPPTQALSQALSQKQRQQLRIIALAPHIVESLFAIGAGEQIIATTAHSDFPKEASVIPQIGNYARLQIEKIVQLQPDVIIAWKNGNPNEDLSRLAQYHLQVEYSQPITLADVADDILLLGRITGREEQAQQVASRYLEQLHDLQMHYANATPVKVFYELWSRPLRTVANQAWPQQQLELCGASNPFGKASDDYPQVGLEQVLVSLPQVVIQPTMNNSNQADALDWQQWPHIPAAKNNFILHPNADKVHRMTIRMLDEVSVMCEQIEQARQFYQATSRPGSTNESDKT